MTVTSPPRWKSLVKNILWLALPLAAGLALALLVPQPSVGLIYLDQAIMPATANNIIAQIAYARQRPEVRAVVFIVDSPGGTVLDTESIYQEVERLRLTKPVVASVESVSASGAYYVAAGTDYIYAKPSSDVGNIGVINILSLFPPLVFEDLVSTGPYKLWGAPSDTVLRRMEVIKQGFYQAVKLGRGDALRASPQILLSGEIWPGQEALRLGLVDELGSRSQAIEKAADMARISHYQVVNLREKLGLPIISTTSFYASAPNGAPAGAHARYPEAPGLYMLYVPPSERRLP